MKDERKKSIHEKYKVALQKGERFWPDSIYKDLLVSCGIFILLILLATFVGVPSESKANPADTSYVPKPEWYFLFLFKFLALFGQIPVLGKIEWIATVVIPAFVLIVLFVLPLTDKNPSRHYSQRILAISIMGVFVVSMVMLTLMANIPTTTLAAPQFLAGLALPGLAYIILAILSFVGRKSPQKAGHWEIGVAGVTSLAMVAMTIVVLVLAPPTTTETETQVASTVAEQMTLGQDLYSINCVECHGADGEGGVIQGVEGLDGFDMKAINSQDEMYTRDDQSLGDIISYGQPNLGMQPFGSTYGGELSPTDIDNIVTFMRYTWDDRAELPAGTSPVASIPTLNAGETPSYDVHISALVKRYCISCHRAGKQNNNYLMTSYDEMLTTGDNAPVMTAGDSQSLMLQLITGHESIDPNTGNTIRQMPPTKLLDQQYIDMLTGWVLAGMPQTAEDAAQVSP